ncbi:hypothetical protein BH09BAC1_BH09BAC1_16070 [soil metagenome]
MAAIKPHNKPGIYSSAIFLLSFACWVGAVWLAANKTTTPAALENTIKWIDNLSVIPFGIGAFIGLRALYQRDTNPMFPFAGFALNGIMVFRIVYGWLGWAIGW